MPNDFIKCNTTDSTAFMANDVVQAARQVRTLFDLLESIIDRGQHMFEPDPVDFVPFETACGLKAGEGELLYELLNGTYLALTGVEMNAQAVALKNRVG